MPRLSLTVLNISEALGKYRKIGFPASSVSHPTRFGNPFLLFLSRPHFSIRNRSRPSASHVLINARGRPAPATASVTATSALRMIASFSPVESEACSKSLAVADTRFGLDQFSAETPPVREPEGGFTWMHAVAPLRPTRRFLD